MLAMQSSSRLMQLLRFTFPVAAIRIIGYAPFQTPLRRPFKVSGGCTDVELLAPVTQRVYTRCHADIRRRKELPSMPAMCSIDANSAPVTL